MSFCACDGKEKEKRAHNKLIDEKLLPTGSGECELKPGEEPEIG